MKSISGKPEIDARHPPHKGRDEISIAFQRPATFQTATRLAFTPFAHKKLFPRFGEAEVCDLRRLEKKGGGDAGGFPSSTAICTSEKRVQMMGCYREEPKTSPASARGWVTACFA